LNSAAVMQIFASLMWNAALIIAPLLLAMLVTGLLVSVLQAVTQIQDMTLIFVPKIIAAATVLVLFGPWMLRKLVQFTTELISNIPSYV
jgi:flagellar biosynthetic protein FliQ